MTAAGEMYCHACPTCGQILANCRCRYGVITMRVEDAAKLRAEFICSEEPHDLEWDGTDLDTIASEYKCHWCNYRMVKP